MAARTVDTGRIAERTDDPYGTTAADRGMMLRHLQEVEPRLRASAMIEIDASAPLEAVVHQLEQLDRPGSSTAIRERASAGSSASSRAERQVSEYPGIMRSDEKFEPRRGAMQREPSGANRGVRGCRRCRPCGAGCPDGGPAGLRRWFHGSAGLGVRGVVHGGSAGRGHIRRGRTTLPTPRRAPSPSPRRSTVFPSLRPAHPVRRTARGIILCPPNASTGCEAPPEDPTGSPIT